MEVDFSSKTGLSQAKDYILGTNGEIRTVILLDCTYTSLRERLEHLMASISTEGTLELPDTKPFTLTVMVLRAVHNKTDGALEVDVSDSKVPITATSTDYLRLSLHDLDARLPDHVPINVPLRNIYTLAEQAADQQALKDTYTPIKTPAAAKDKKNKDDGTGEQNEQDRLAREQLAVKRPSIKARIKTRFIQSYSTKKRYYSTQSQSRTAHAAATATLSFSSMMAPVPAGQASCCTLYCPAAGAGLVVARRPIALAPVLARGAAPAPALAYRSAISVQRSVGWLGGLFSRRLR